MRPEASTRGAGQVDFASRGQGRAEHLRAVRAEVGHQQAAPAVAQQVVGQDHVGKAAVPRGKGHALDPFALLVRAGVFIPDDLVARLVAAKDDVQVAVARQVAERGRAAGALDVFVEDVAIPAAIALAVLQQRQAAVLAADDDVVPTIIVHIAGEQYRVAGIRPYLVPKNAQDLLLKHHVFIPPRTIIPKKRALAHASRADLC